MPDYIDLNNMFLYLGIAATFFYVLKTAMFMFGGGDVEVDADFNSLTDTDASFHFISLQSILAFLMGFGWGGLLAHVQLKLNAIASLFVAVASGIVLMSLCAYLFYLVNKLNHSVRVDLNDLCGKTGKAYVSFEPGSNGQIEIEINNKLSIYDAINSSDIKINSFEIIKVVKVENNKIYIEKGE